MSGLALINGNKNTVYYFSFMFALAWQDNDVWSELLLLMKAFTVCGSSTLVEHTLERLRYRSVLTSLPDQVSPNARHWCCKTFTTAQSQWLDLHACIHTIQVERRSDTDPVIHRHKTYQFAAGRRIRSPVACMEEPTKPVMQCRH